MTPTYGSITECNVTAPPRESGLTYTAALTAQIADADLTRIDLTRPVTILHENPND